MAAAVQAWRTPPERVVRRFNVRWLCLRSPEKLDEVERDALARVLAEHPDIAAAHELLGRFRRLVAERDLAALDAWVADARASRLAPFEGFANGLGADRAAIEAAFALPRSTGPVEGHVHRLKLIKRRWLRPGQTRPTESGRARRLTDRDQRARPQGSGQLHHNCGRASSRRH